MFAAGAVCRLVPALALLVACGGGDLLLPGQGEPANIRVARGNGQSGRVGVALAEPVVALVTDAQARPVAGSAVAFALADGTDATVTPDTKVTGPDGEAAFQVTMGTRVGSVSAHVLVNALSAPVSLTAVSADANGLAAVSGDGQTAPVGAALPQPLTVQVTDGFGNPIPGVDISWTPDAGGLSEGHTVTGPDGLSSVRRTLGPSAGTQHTLASAPGLAGSPVDFSHTATAGAASVLELVSGDGQSGLVGTALPAPLVVRAHDADGNPVPGLAVAWIPGQGGGALAPTTSITDADGRASTQWTLGGAPGPNSATAVISGVGTVTFTATGNPGTPPGLTLAIQPPAAAVRGVVLSPAPVVQLREPDGSVRRRQGVNVSVALLPGGASIRGTHTRATDSDGRATFSGLSLEGPLGSYALAFSATGYSGVTSTSITLARAGTTTTIQSDDPDPSAAGQAVRVRFRVQSPGGTPDGAVQVTSDDGASCSAAVSAGECSLVPTATGTGTLTATYPGSDEFESSADTEGHTVAAPQPIPTTTRITADDPDPSDVGQAVAVGFSVTAASGTPTGTVTVTASGGGESCAASVGDGVCTLALTGAGDRTLTATYAPDAGFAGSDDTDPHTVRPPPPPPDVPSATASSVTVSDPTPALNHDTRVTVVVRDDAGKKLDHITVSLSVTGDGNAIDPATATSDKKGEAKFTVRSSVAGTKTITATASGVTLAEQPTITVQPAATRIGITTDAPDPSAPGESVIVGFAVSSDGGTPSGAVTVTASSGESCGGAAPVGSCSLAPPVAGSISITASYTGDGNFTASSAQTSHTVIVPLPPVLTIRTQPSGSAVPGQAFARQPEIQLRTATGSELKQAGVTIAVELATGAGALSGTATAVTDADGRAAFSDLGIDGPPGTYAIRFTAAGFTPAESEPITLSLAPSTTKIVADTPDPSLVGEVVTVQFAIEGDGGTPTGSVTVTSDGGESCTAAVSDGGCAIAFVAAGSFALTAAYGGDATFAASTSDPEQHAVAEPAPPAGVRAASSGPAAAPGRDRLADSTLLSHLQQRVYHRAYGQAGGSLTSMLSMIRLQPPIVLLVPLAAAACGGGDLVLPDEGQASKVTYVSGNLQTGTILAPAAESLVVRVLDRFNNPVPGVAVSWSAQGGGDVSPASVVTGTDGRAATQRMLGAQVGNYGTAAVATPLPESVVTFTTTAVAAKLALQTQPGPTAASGAALDPQPVLQLEDPLGAPLARPGVVVTVQIASGDGALQGTTSRESDANGLVAFTDLTIVGGPGARTLIFAAAGYASAISSPVSLGVGAPASVAISAGDGQSVTAGAAVPLPPAVIVRDAGGTPLAGIPVSFAVNSGGGSVTGANATTGVNGVATAGGWTLGGAAGANTLKATVGAPDVTGNPVTFTATGTAGNASPARSSVAVSPQVIPASTGSSSSVVTVVVRDGAGNPIAGQAVALSATGGGVSLTQPGVTDGSGTTAGRFSATSAGDHTITAVTGGVTLGAKTVTVTGGPAEPSRSTADVPAGTAGTETVVTVRLQDGFGNPVSGAADQLDMAVSGANSGANVDIADAGNGAYTARYTPQTAGTDLLDLRLGGQPIPGSPFTSTVAPGAADPDRTTATVPDGVFATPLEILVQVADAQGNPLGRGGDVVVVSPPGTASITAEDRGDGTYRAVWTPFVVGTVKVAITLNGTAIHGSAFTTHIRFFR